MDYYFLLKSKVEEIDTIDLISQVISSKLSSCINEIYLFGSFADGTNDENSDYDIYIIVDDSQQANTFNLTTEIKKSVDNLAERNIDLIISTKSSFLAACNNPDSIEYQVMEKGILLYGKTEKIQKNTLLNLARINLRTLHSNSIRIPSPYDIEVKYIILYNVIRFMALFCIQLYEKTNQIDVELSDEEICKSLKDEGNIEFEKLIDLKNLLTAFKQAEKPDSEDISHYERAFEAMFSEINIIYQKYRFKWREGI